MDRDAFVRALREQLAKDPRYGAREAYDQVRERYLSLQKFRELSFMMQATLLALGVLVVTVIGFSWTFVSKLEAPVVRRVAAVAVIMLGVGATHVAYVYFADRL